MLLMPGGKKKGLFVHLLWLSFYFLLLSCTKTGGKPDPSLTNSFSQESNLLTDGTFEEWKPENLALKQWNSSTTPNGIITRAEDSSGVMFSANAAGGYYIYQKVTLEARKFYKVAVTADYTLNDYSAAGIYVMDTTMKRVLGKYEKVYSSASGETWQFIFYSRKAVNVDVVIGFLNGINGTALFKGASIQEYKYEPVISGSAFSSHLRETLHLSFLPRTYDSAVSLIGDYVDMVLQANGRFFTDTVENTYLDTYIGSDSNYKYFNQYRHQPEQVHDGYCQRSSLSLGEILTNEFNIPVRQMYMQFAGIGKHQFLEYWNPFARRWIIIDPCFNVRYVKDGRLLGDEDFTQTEAPDLMVRFGSHYFYENLDELVSLWQGMDELIVTNYFSLTYPYAD
jgi:hypothetical protein